MEHGAWSMKNETNLRRYALCFMLYALCFMFYDLFFLAFTFLTFLGASDFLDNLSLNF